MDWKKIKLYIKKHKFETFIILCLILIGAYYGYKNSHKPTVVIPLSEAVSLSNQKDFSSLTIVSANYVNELTMVAKSGENATIQDINGKNVKLTSGEKVYTNIGTLNINDLISLGFTLPETYSQSPITFSWVSLAGNLGLLLGLIFVFFLMGGTSLFSSGNKFKPSDTNVRFKDIGGLDEVKDNLMDIVSFLKNSDSFAKNGARIPRGILLEGLPGTGKTLLAQAVATEAGVNFYYTTGSEFHNMWVGLAAMKVKNLFKKANKSPSVVFIDEFDSIATKRALGSSDVGREWNHTLNQLLAEMDGFKKNAKVIVLAATNRADVLDPAVLRAGRFDRKIVIPLPNYQARCEILKIHSKDKYFDKDVTFESVAKQTSGFSGADLALLLNEAAILSTKDNKDTISNENIVKALDKVLVGEERKGYKITKEERSMIAYHEAGHAIVATFVPNGDKVQRISILPHGSSGGFTRLTEQNETLILPKSKAISNLAILLGGRASEEIAIKDITSGSSEDIKRANELATEMVEHFGMSEHYGIRYCTKNQIGDNNIGNETSSIIDSDIKSILEQAFGIAKDILNKNRELLDKIATKLLEVETLNADEIEKILGS